MKIIFSLVLCMVISYFSFGQRTTTYHYDVNNQLLNTYYPNGIVYNYAYDNLGNRTSKTVIDISSVLPSAFLTDLGNGLIQLDWFVNSNNSTLDLFVLGGCVVSSGFSNTIGAGGGTDVYQLIGEGTVQVLISAEDASGQSAEDLIFIDLGSLSNPSLYLDPLTSFTQSGVFNVNMEYNNGDYGSLSLSAFYVESDGDTIPANPYYDFDSTLTDGNYQLNFSSLISGIPTDAEYLIIQGTSIYTGCSSPIVYSNAFYLDNLNTGVSNVKGNEFSIYPNPASHYLNIETDFKKRLTVLLEDSKGSVVFDKIFDYGKQKLISIDVSDLAHGVYNVSFIDLKGNLLESKNIILAK